MMTRAHWIIATAVLIGSITVIVVLMWPLPAESSLKHENALRSFFGGSLADVESESRRFEAIYSSVDPSGRLVFARKSIRYMIDEPDLQRFYDLFRICDYILYSNHQELRPEYEGLVDRLNEYYKQYHNGRKLAHITEADGVWGVSITAEVR